MKDSDTFTEISDCCTTPVETGPTGVNFCAHCGKSDPRTSRFSNNWLMKNPDSVNFDVDDYLTDGSDSTDSEYKISKADLSDFSIGNLGLEMGGGDDMEEDINERPADIMNDASETYKQKNDDYGASWYEIGEVLYKMAGGESVTIDSPEDWVRVGLYTRRLDKFFRAFAGEMRGEEKNFESVMDSHEDESVYAAMSAAMAELGDSDG